MRGRLGGAFKIGLLCALASMILASAAWAHHPVPSKAAWDYGTPTGYIHTPGYPASVANRPWGIENIYDKLWKHLPGHGYQEPAERGGLWEPYQGYDVYGRAWCHGLNRISAAALARYKSKGVFFRNVRCAVNLYFGTPVTRRGETCDPTRQACVPSVWGLDLAKDKFGVCNPSTFPVPQSTYGYCHPGEFEAVIFIFGLDRRGETYLVRARWVLTT